MKNWKLKNIKDLKEVHGIINHLPKDSLKYIGVIGSYLFTDNWNDIDFICYDIKTGYLLRKVTADLDINIQIVFCTEDEFYDFKNLLTFYNTSVVYMIGTNEYLKSEKYIESDILYFNNNSLRKFKNSNVIIKEIEKMKRRGFKLNEE